VREKEGTGGEVIKLTTIVTLDSLDGEAELCGHPSEEVKKRGKSIRLRTQGKSPRIVRKIIDRHKIVLISRDTDDRSQEMSIGRNVQDQTRGPHVKKNYEKKDEHDGPICTHDTNAQQ
jgi:hypothetical protein